MIELAKFTTHESDTGIIFTILDGDYAGVRYQYGVVSMAEPTGNSDMATLKFSFAIVESNIENLQEDNQFSQTIGRILEFVIAGLSESDDNTVIEEVDYVDTTDEIQKIL